MLAKFKMRLVAFVTCLLVAGNIAGCSNGDSQTFAWPLATASPEDTVTQLFAVKFAQEVSEKSDGRMKIEVYPNSTLGGDRDLLESCADGDIPFLVQNTAPQVTFMKDLAVFDLPCVFDSLEELRQTIDQPEFQEVVDQVYLDGGYRLLGMADQGFRIMSTNKNVTCLQDFKGQKIRTMENPYHLRFWEALGASPTPMSFAEVYIGLQQHTIDAQENPYEVIVSNRLYEQQDYMVETNHLPHLLTLITNEAFYQSLPQEDQKIIDEAAQVAVEYARQMSDERISERIETIEQSGSQIVELDEDTKEAIRQQASSVYTLIQNSIDPNLYEAYVN